MRANATVKIFLSILILIVINFPIFAGEKKFVTKEEFHIAEARQGIAVDENYIYVIGTREIGKYNKITHEFVNKWAEADDGPIKHLDSGVIIDGKLYCAHSNYPEIPMTSSIEIWDAKTLEHIESHSFGIYRGSCTWADYSNGYWYAAFGHYKKWKHLTGKDASWTSIVKFDQNWMELESWVLPNNVVEKFEKMSNSGGSFGPDNLLYCSGHDAPELYVLKFPQMGSILELVEIMPINIAGQGIAWDRSNPNYIYGIIKKEKKVIISELVDK